MFGKGKRAPSETDRFVMAKGRHMGNLKRAKPASKSAPKKKTR